MKIQRYLGISVIAVSLVVFSIGSVPQSFAGTTGFFDIDMLLGSSCGISMLTFLASYGAFPVGTQQTIQLSAINTGTSLATITANAGTDSATGPGGGGFAAVSGITNISAGSIDLQIGSQGFTAGLDPAGGETTVGTIFGADTVDVRTTADVINGPVAAGTSLSGTVVITASC